jgi:Ala-tRNA(Pro) deacylase
LPSAKLKEYLKSRAIEFEEIVHHAEYSAQRAAEAAHVSGHQLAKTIIVKINGRPAMTVLPASGRVDFALLKEVVGSEEVELAREHEFTEIFPDCEIGAMPPFGNIYNLDVYIAEVLTTNPFIIFKACSHSVLIRMAYDDYRRLVNPIVLHFVMP